MHLVYDSVCSNHTTMVYGYQLPGIRVQNRIQNPMASDILVKDSYTSQIWILDENRTKTCTWYLVSYLAVRIIYDWSNVGPLLHTQLHYALVPGILHPPLTYTLDTFNYIPPPNRLSPTLNPQSEREGHSSTPRTNHQWSRSFRADRWSIPDLYDL